MEGKLREITDRIYLEGVERARREADQLLAEAKNQAEHLIAEARREAQHLHEHNQRAIEQLRENTLQELQFSARQAIAGLKQKITDLITIEILSDPLQEAFSDSNFVQHIIQTVVSNWTTNDGADPELQLLLPEKERQQLDAFISERAAALLSKGVHIRFNERLNNGFRIGPADGRYIISFTQEDFEQFFKMHLRPQIEQLLFNHPPPTTNQ